MSNIKKLMASAAGGQVGLDVDDVFSMAGYVGSGDYQTQDTSVNLTGGPEYAGMLFGTGNVSYLPYSSSVTDSSGNIYVAFQTGQGGDPNSRSFVIEKWNANFEGRVWSVRYGRTDTTDQITPRLRISENDNLYLVGGYGSTAFAMIAKVNKSTGALDWSKAASVPNGHFIINISEDSTGTYVYAAGTAYKTGGRGQLLVKLAVSNGAQQWAKVFYWDVNEDEFAYDCQVLGSYVYLVGYIKTGSTRYSSITRVGTDGTTATNSTRYFTQNSSQYTQLDSITTDGTDLFVTGYTNNYGMMIAKIDPSWSTTPTIYHRNRSGSTSHKGKCIFYNTNDNLLYVTTWGEHAASVNGSSSTGWGIQKVNPSTMAVTGTMMFCEIPSNNEINTFISGNGTKQMIDISGGFDSTYQDTAVQVEIKDFESLTPSLYLPQMQAQLAYNTEYTSPDTNTTRTLTNVNLGVTYSNTTLAADTNGGTPAITTKDYFPALDAADTGGLVWIKAIQQAQPHMLYDTLRGPQKYINTNATTIETTDTNTEGLRSFGSGGFNLGNSSYPTNTNGYQYISYTFRRAPKFFDMVYYTGNGTHGRTITHNLGVAPGMIMIKNLDDTQNWFVYHKSLGSGNRLYLNMTNPSESSTRLYSTDPTDTTITFDNSSDVNRLGSRFIAYLFADNNGDAGFGPNADQDIIKCGSYVGSGSDNGPVVDLGFEPGWVLIKNTGQHADWQLFDSQRNWKHGWYAQQRSTNDSSMLEPSNTTGEGTRDIMRLSNGFQPIQNISSINSAGQTYVYMAIRKNTLFPPTNGNQVWDYGVYYGNAYQHPSYNASFTPDLGFKLNTGGSTNYPLFWTRLGMARQTSNDSSSFRTTDYGYFLFDNRGWMDNAIAQNTSTGLESWMWRCAPGFMDMLGYVGTGANRTVSHNLTTEPGMIWVRSWETTPWTVWHKDFASSTTSYALLNSTNAPTTAANVWNSTAPTSTEFSVGTSSYTNTNGYPYQAILFGSVEGVSKCGTFNTTTDTNIDCGFMDGARFVMFKRINADSSHWWVMTAQKNYQSGDELYYRLNYTGGHLSINFLDPYSAGFKLNTSLINNATYTGTYIYYAIA